MSVNENKNSRLSKVVIPKDQSLSDPHAIVSVKHYMQGARCGQYRQPRSNPYPANSWEAFSWTCGYEDEQ